MTTNEPEQPPDGQVARPDATVADSTLVDPTVADPTPVDPAPVDPTLQAPVADGATTQADGAWVPPAGGPGGAPAGARGPLVISAEELASPTVDARANAMRQANAPQLVRAVGPPPQRSSRLRSVLPLVLAGLVGGLLGWAASELIAQPYAFERAMADCFENFDPTNDACNYEPWYGRSETKSAIAFIAPFAIVVGMLIAGWDGISSRSPAKFLSLAGRALPLLAVAGVLGGWLSQEYYSSAIEDATSVDDLHFPRGVAWAIAMTGIGLAVGAASRSGKRAVNGALGGAIGGFVGGFVFDYIDLSDTDGLPNRVVGLVLTGLVVGTSIGLVETARRQHWLEIVSGGMAGKQFILYHDLTTIGSGHDCHVTLIKDQGIGAQHAFLERQGDGLVARSVNPAAPLSVNGVATVEARLAEGDLMQMGSTVLRYRAKAAAMPTGMPGFPAGGTPPGAAGGAPPMAGPPHAAGPPSGW